MPTIAKRRFCGPPERRADRPVGALWTLCAAMLFVLLFAVELPPLVRGDEPVAAGDLDAHRTRFRHWLGQFEETQFRYKSLATRSTPDEGACGKWKTNGHVRVSAAQRSLHFTHSGMSTWAKDAGDIAEDHGTTELVLDGKSLLDLTIVTYTELSPEPIVDVKVTQPVPKGSWERALAAHPLGLLLGYLPYSPHVKGALNGKSLMALLKEAECKILQSAGEGTEELVGFRGRSAECELSVLFDPARQFLLRKLEIRRATDEVEPLGVERAALTVLSVRREGEELSSIKIKTVLELAPGNVDVSAVSGAVLREAPKGAARNAIPPQIFETTFEIVGFRRLTDPLAAWLTLDNAIPKGTPVQINGNLPTHHWKNGKIEKGTP